MPGGADSRRPTLVLRTVCRDATEKLVSSGLFGRRGLDVSASRADPVRDRGGLGAGGDVELVEDV